MNDNNDIVTFFFMILFGNHHCWFGTWIVDGNWEIKRDAVLFSETSDLTGYVMHSAVIILCIKRAYLNM